MSTAMKWCGDEIDLLTDYDQYQRFEAGLRLTLF